jgi:hypothetical protein
MAQNKGEKTTGGVTKVEKGISGKGVESKNYMNVPAEVVRKLQEGNEKFIVAYNPHKITQSQSGSP